jgi:hypothetical protein
LTPAGAGERLATVERVEQTEPAHEPEGSAPKAARVVSDSPAAANALVLQRAVGNRAATQVLQRGIWNDIKKALGASYTTTVEGETVLVASKAEEVEAGEIIKRIEADYNIDISAVKAVKATVDAYANAPQKERDKVKVSPWLMRELRATDRALKHYSRILGLKRVMSTRKDAAQEVTVIGKGNMSITEDSAKGKIDPNTLGEYYESATTFAIYEPGESYIGDLGSVDRELEGTIIHEIAHGVMSYAQDDFNKTTGFWRNYSTKSKKKGAEPPPTKYGNKSAGEDLSETMRWYFMVPEKLKKKCPIRYAWAKAQIEGWTPIKDMGDFPEKDPLEDGVAIA